MDNQNQGKSAVGLGAAVSPVRNMLNSITNRHNAARDEIARQKLQEEMDQSQNMYECSLITDDEDVKKKNLSGCNLNNMSTLIKTYYSGMNNHDCDTMDPAQTCCYFLNRNPEAERITDAVLKCEEGVDLEMWADRVGIQNDQEPQIEDPYIQDFTENWDGKGKSWGNVIGAGGVGLLGLDAAAWPVGRGIEWMSEQAYEKAFRPTSEAASQVMNVGSEIDYVKGELMKAEDWLKSFTEPGAERTAAEKKVAELRKSLEELTEKYNTIQTTSKTASKYNIGGGLFKNWTAESIGRQALTESKKVWRDIIEKSLNASKESVNVEQMTKGLRKKIEEKYRLDKEALGDLKAAYKKIVEWYSGDEFQNVTLKDVQRIKSKLQRESADVIAKIGSGKKALQKNISWAIKEIKGMLGKELKDTMHNLLHKAGLLESEELFEDWWNLTNIAQRYGNMSAEGEILGNTIDKSVQAEFKNRLYTKLSNFGKKLGSGIKKSSFIDWIINGVKKNRAKLNSKSLSRGLSPEALGAIIAGEVMYDLGIEWPEEHIADIIAYALETNKLNKEGNRDLPLYSEESYVNQNPNKDLTFEEKKQEFEENNIPYKMTNRLLENVGLGGEDVSIYDQDWYKALLEEEKENEEKYKETMEGIDFGELIDLLD